MEQAKKEATRRKEKEELPSSVFQLTQITISVNFLLLLAFFHFVRSLLKKRIQVNPERERERERERQEQRSHLFLFES